MTRLDRLMELPLVYRSWQAPFAARKLAPVLLGNDLTDVRRVLDVACGPGTNAARFSGAEYVGIDVNERYIASAQRRFPGRFVRADAMEWSGQCEERFDFILVNSFLHHLDDRTVALLLRRLAALLEPGGRIHILELVLPSSRSVARMLARADRGKYARPLDAWSTLLAGELALAHWQPYAISVLGLPLWHMIYAVGHAAEAVH